MDYIKTSDVLKSTFQKKINDLKKDIKNNEERIVNLKNDIEETENKLKNIDEDYHEKKDNNVIKTFQFIIDKKYDEIIERLKDEEKYFTSNSTHKIYISKEEHISYNLLQKYYKDLKTRLDKNGLYKFSDVPDDTLNGFTLYVSKIK